MIQPYKKRHFKSLENWQVDDLIIKPYAINKDQHAINNDLITKSILYAQQILPSILKEHNHNNMGYAIIHKGDMGIWLLLHCWAYDDIVLSTLAFAQSEQYDFVCYDDKPFHACVWEHVLINHERNAWVENVLCDNSCIGGYLNNRLKDGKY